MGTTDKRGTDRHVVRFKLIYDDGSSFNAGVVDDLSESGAFIETGIPLPVGSTFVLSSLDLDDAHAFELEARVVRVVEEDGLQPAGMGVTFENLTDERRAFLHALIERVETEERASAGDRDIYLNKTLPKDGFERAPSGVYRVSDTDEPSS